MAYYLLVGEPVFNGANLVEVCAHHLYSKPTRPSERGVPDVSPELEAIVLACLAKKPEDRPASALALRRALLECPISPWTDSDAEAFWQTHADQLRRPADIETGAPPTELSVDLSAR